MRIKTLKLNKKLRHKELVYELNRVYGSFKRFTSNDVAQYIIRGYLPHRYGGFKLQKEKVTTEINSTTYITVLDEKGHPKK
jgi:hypothetical protein